MDLAGADRYNPERLPALEEAVEAQVRGGQYNMDVNCALLRFYQFYPGRVKLATLSKVLVSALVRLPDPDFSLCMHLVPERLQAEEPFSSLANAAAALEGARFAEFWQLAAQLKDLFDTVGEPSVADQLRQHITYVVGQTYQRIAAAEFAAMLDLGGKAFDDFYAKQCAAKGWAKDGGMLVVPKNASNAPTAVAEGTIPFTVISEVFKGSAAAPA